MADTTARALQLLEILQSAQLRTVTELSQRLGVDERTVRRDVARLADLGLPVEALRGRYGGYRLATGHRGLPLMFSNEEVVAVYLGLSQAQAATPEPEIPAQTALAKIKRALPNADAKRIDTLLAVMTGSHAAVAVDPGVMLSLAEAVNRRHVLELRYLNGKGIPSRRTIHPYGLAAHSNRWYLLAFDTDRQEERTFRVDRIRSVRAISGTFMPPNQVDMRSHLIDHFAEADYRWHVVLYIQAAAEHIRSHLPASIARLEKLDRGMGRVDDGDSSWHRAEIHAESLDWLPSVIAGLDCEVVIESPDELRNRVRYAARRMLHTAGDDEYPSRS